MLKSQQVMASIIYIYIYYIYTYIYIYIYLYTYIYHNGFRATDVHGHTHVQFMGLLKCNICHKTIKVMTRRGYCTWKQWCYCLKRIFFLWETMWITKICFGIFKLTVNYSNFSNFSIFIKTLLEKFWSKKFECKSLFTIATFKKYFPGLRGVFMKLVFTLWMVQMQYHNAVVTRFGSLYSGFYVFSFTFQDNGL